ncbi:MAG: peptidylprolyl isomerase [Candidatus Zixiibacteriota bacterium]
MNRLKYTAYIILPILVFAVSSVAQRETVDKISAVVGNQVILASELTGQLQLFALQTGQQPKNEEELLQLQTDVLEQMISDRLFLIAAQEDTSLSIRPEEIDEMLDEQIARISKNFNSYNDFLAALTAEGLSVRELKKKYRPDVENQILKQRYIQKKLYNVSVSKYEVEAFYNQFQDSIPKQPEAVKLAHILLPIQPSLNVIDSVKQVTVELRQRILEGADFAAISLQYSSSGAGANGGDLGYVSREDVVPEFARAAFNLSVGDISGVIRTQFGFHVIRCEGKKGNKLKLRHLLLMITPSKEDTLKTINLVDSLLEVCRQGGDFSQLAKEFSADNDSRVQGGELGWFASAELPQEFIAAVSGWKTPGEYRGPVISKMGFHILKLLDYQDERIYTLENDFDKIKELARQDKTGKFVDKWIAEIKNTTYIHYNLD